MGNRPHAILMSACVLTDSQKYKMIRPLRELDNNFDTYAEDLVRDISQTVSYDDPMHYFIGTVYAHRDWDDSQNSVDVSPIRHMDSIIERATALDLLKKQALLYEVRFKDKEITIPPEWYKFVADLRIFIETAAFDTYLIAAWR